MLGSGWPLLLRPRDGAQGLPEVDWFGSEDLSDSEVDDTDRLPREEDLDEEDELPMAAEVVRWVEEGLGGNAAPTDDNDEEEEEEEEGWADRNLAGAAMAEVTELGLVLGLISGFSRETDSLLCILILLSLEQDATDALRDLKLYVELTVSWFWVAEDDRLGVLGLALLLSTSLLF